VGPCSLLPAKSAIDAISSSSRRVHAMLVSSRRAPTNTGRRGRPRNLVQASTIAFEVLKKGNVGLAGSTAAVLHRNLLALAVVVDNSTAGVRLTNGLQHSAGFSVSTFVDELASPQGSSAFDAA
jgi:hypothetical protein